MEVYGEKPKRFTHEWWEYIWMYYKWHIVCTIFVVFMVVLTINQCANQTKYDLTVTVVTEKEVVLTQTDMMKEYAQKVVDDVTGNGINDVLISSIHIGAENNAEYHSAQLAKMTVELSMPESYVYIINRSFADMAIENEILEKTECWAGDLDSDGYVVSLKGNERLRELGLNPDQEELFIGVGALFEKDKNNELEKGRHENGVKLARNILGLE